MSRFTLAAFADEIDTNLKVQMDVLDQHDIKYIEMRGVNGKNLVEHSLSSIREIKKNLDARDFKISAVGSPIGKISINDDFVPHLDLFKYTIEVAKILDTKYIRMFSFFIPQGENPAKYRDEVLHRWQLFVQVAKGSGLTLLHENEKEIYGDTAERCLDLLETLNCDYVRATFDPANFIQCDVKPFPDAYHLLSKYVDYMHIKDAIFGDRHVVPVGAGDGNVKSILEDLYRRGYNGFLSVEPHLGSFKGFAEQSPDAVGAELSDSGPEKFAIATNALKDMVKEIQG